MEQGRKWKRMNRTANKHKIDLFPNRHPREGGGPQEWPKDGFFGLDFPLQERGQALRRGDGALEPQVKWNETCGLYFRAEMPHFAYFEVREQSKMATKEQYHIFR